MKTHYLLAFLLLIAHQVHAESVTTYELSELCESEDSIDQLDCTYYFDATLATYVSLTELFKVPYPCTHNRFSNVQAQKIFLKWADENPKYLHAPASLAILVSLIRTYGLCETDTKR